MKNALAIVTLAMFSLLLAPRVYPQKQPCVYYKNTCFLVELAKTAAEHTQGLMFRKKLDDNKGMLFIFNDESKVSFWMKNTLISLDMIWLDKNKTVVFIEKNVKPCLDSACPPITPDKNAMYVLELNAGTCTKLGIALGDKIIFDID